VDGEDGSTDRKVGAVGRGAADLQRWVRRPKSAQALALRAKIVLACAAGATNKDVAAEFSVTAQMVGKWRARFVAHRLAGLSDEDRPGEVSDRLCTRSTIS